MPKYKTFAEMYIAGNGFCIAADDGKFGIWNIKTKVASS